MLGGAAIVVIGGGWTLMASGDDARTVVVPAPSASPRGAAPAPHQPARLPSLNEVRAPSLVSPVQNAAAAPSGPLSALLLGGLTAADISRADVRGVSPTGDRSPGTLPVALHDEAAVSLGGTVYLFGGGDGVRQLDSIIRVDPSSGRSTTVGTLPRGASDVAAAAVGDTAYVVGGGRKGLAAAGDATNRVPLAGEHPLQAGADCVVVFDDEDRPLAHALTGFPESSGVRVCHRSPLTVPS